LSIFYASFSFILSIVIKVDSKTSGGFGLFRNFKIQMRIVKLIVYRTVFLAATVLFLAAAPSSLLANTLTGDLTIGRLLNFATGLSESVSSLGSLSQLADFSGSAVEGDDALIISEVGFSSVDQSSVLDIEDQIDTTEDDDIVASVIGDALVFPNPFRQSTSIGAVLGYELSKDLEVDIQVFNMFAQSVAQVSFNSGVYGGSKGYNRVQINKSSLGGIELSAGVYFYLIMNDGNVLARGKMAVKP
jgi:hypothetical protein